MTVSSPISARVKVLFFTQGDLQTPSSRERLFKLLPLLEKRGIDALVPPIARSILPHTLLSDLRLARQADVIFIQKRTMFPSNVALLSMLRPLVYDFDDALYAAWPKPEGYASGSQAIGHRRRLLATLKRASLVIAGNEELRGFAQPYCATVKVIPTSLAVHPEIKEHSGTEEITIGWIGTPGNLLYLQRMPAILQALNEKIEGVARLKVVCSQPLGDDIPFIEFKAWSLENETVDLMSFDIGIMPLVDDDWTRGKCGFKLLQYASVGLPVVASPVGVNCEVVKNGESGFLAETDDEWVSGLEKLSQDVSTRSAMGRSGWEHVRRNYSPEEAADLLAGAIREAATGPLAARAKHE